MKDRVQGAIREFLKAKTADGAFVKFYEDSGYTEIKFDGNFIIEEMAEFIAKRITE